MRVVIKLSARAEADAAAFHFLTENRTYGMKSRSFMFSVLFHLAVGAALLLPKSAPPLRPGQQIYETLIRPQEKKLIWHHFKAELPNIDSSTQKVKEGPNRGRIHSPKLVIAQSQKGSHREFVWQDTPVELPDVVKAPNLIALRRSPAMEGTPLPAPQAPKPRNFVPPPVTAQPQPSQPAMIPLPSAPFAGATPAVSVNLPSVLDTGQMKVYKPFVAPPGQKSGVKGGTGSSPGTDPAPGPDAPNLGTSSNLNIAAINLDSVLGGSTVPPGRRPGNFSAGPNVGEPSAERSVGRTALVPGLTTRGNNSGESSPNVRPDPPPPPNIPRREITYREVIGRPVGSSLSVPLQPGARRIPAALDLLFGDRPVYTMILPAPKMPQYAGDWILWFSEVKPTPGDVVQIRAPLPEKKLESDAVSYSWGSEVDLRLNLVIDENGRVQSVKVAKISPDLPPQVALDDLKTWVFKPATRNGVPIPVQAVLDIPFRKLLASGSK